MPSTPLLHHRRITAPGAEPRHGLLVLHGIYGAGRNWGAVARRLIGERPDWGVVLVDLRQHGRSTGRPGPHTLAAAARDLVPLVRATEPRPRAVLGHSFGGKVAMRYAREVADTGDALEELWVVDSMPAARSPSGSAWAMLETLRSHPGPFPTREAGVEAVRSDGFAPPVAAWMGTNLQEDEAGAYRWRLEPDDMESLLRDFFETDTWSVVEAPPPGLRVHVVKALGSSLLSDAACRRVEAAGRRTGRVHLHRLEGGHWLNADNPGGLVDLLSRELPA